MDGSTESYDEKNQARIDHAKSVAARTGGLLKSSCSCFSPEEEELAAEDAIVEEVE
jgi:hypothetical protein